MTQNADHAAIVPAVGHGDRAAGACPGAARDPRRAVGGSPAPSSGWVLGKAAATAGLVA
ncbi:hypothetical protein ACKI1J_29710 [Streptomyces scabiei]|uniref:hypothetical protein n=1 Tax=Streptomyces scabiei TaxID=1930 RepID=UPI0038F5D740